MLKLVVIATGGALGSVLRYLVGMACHGLMGGAYPLGTLVVNVVGCLAIGFFGAAFTGPMAVGDHARLGVIVGLLGGFTTFSAFGYETVNFFQHGKWLEASLNVLLNVAVSLAATWVGIRWAQTALSA